MPTTRTRCARLGAAAVVDRDGDVAAAVRALHPDGVDAVIDLVSYTPDAFAAYEAALADGGKAASPLGAVGDGPGRTAVMALSIPADLERLARMLADGTLTVPVQASYGLDEAPAALASLAGEHTRGKLAITVAP